MQETRFKIIEKSQFDFWSFAKKCNPEKFRDLLIVKLRDEEKKSFKFISKLFNLNYFIIYRKYYKIKLNKSKFYN